MKDTWLNKLIVAVIGFVAIIVIGFLTMHVPALKYELTPQQTLDAISKPDELISPDKAKQLLLSKDQAFEFVDLRNPDDFTKGHAEGALNIPLSKILSQENLETIAQSGKQNKTLILYGTDQLQVTAPWLLLKQMGFANIKILQGGYAGISGSHALAADSLSTQTLDPEAAHYNFASLGKSQAKTGAVLSSKTAVKVVTKPKPKSTAPAAGGC